jgi:hypothetical protein
LYNWRVYWFNKNLRSMGVVDFENEEIIVKFEAIGGVY